MRPKKWVARERAYGFYAAQLSEAQGCSPAIPLDRVSGPSSSQAQAEAIVLRKPDNLETYQGGTVVVREQVASMPNEAVCPCSI